MSLPEQLRSIADRLDAAEAERAAALDELWHIRTVIEAPPVDVPIRRPEAAGAAAVMPPADRVVSPGGSSSAPIQAPVDLSPPAQARGGPRKGVPDGSPALLPSSVRRGSGTSRTDVLTCPECGRELKRQGFQPHMMRVHGAPSATGPPTCPECGLEMLVAPVASLARHRRDQHDVEPWVPQPTGTSAPAAAVRKGAEWYVCSRCELKFPTREARDRHQAMHPPIPDAAPLRAIRPRGGGVGE